MRRFLLVLALLLVALASAQAQSLLGLMGVGGPGIIYQGPLDIVSGAGAIYYLDCASAALATGSTKVVNYRRASDNSAQDGYCLTSGKFDQASAIAFAGTDASGLGAITGTTLTFTGGHVGDTITGAGVSTGTFIVSGSSPTWTVNLSQTVGSTALTLTWPLSATKIYDQSGNSCDVSQATTGNQPRLAIPTPNGDNSLNFAAASSQSLAGTCAASAQPTSLMVIAERISAFTSLQSLLLLINGASAQQIAFTIASGFMSGYAGTNQSLAGATDRKFNYLTAVMAGTSGVLSANNTPTTKNMGTVGAQTGVQIGYNSTASQFLDGYLSGAGFWPSVAFSSTQQTNLCHNAYVAGKTDVSC